MAVLAQGLLPDGAIGAQPRNWVSSDGKSLQGDLLEASEKEVKIRRAGDFQIFKLPLERLSSDDQKFVMGIVREQWRDAGLKTGPYAEKITGKFEKMTSKQGLNYQIYGNPKWDGKTRYPVLIWLHGYYGGKAGDTTIDMDSFDVAGKEIGEACAASPELGLMTVINQIDADNQQ